MLLGPSDCPRLRFNVLSIDYVRVTNCFYDYDYDKQPLIFMLPVWLMFGDRGQMSQTKLTTTDKNINE